MKTADKWREAWVGLRGRARAAYRAKVQYAAGTGGGPPPEVVGLGLNPTYERVLLLVGTSGAEPNNVPDPLMAQLNARAKRVPAATATAIALGAVPKPVPAVQAQVLPAAHAAHAPGLAVVAPAYGPVIPAVPAVQAQALPQGQREVAARAVAFSPIPPVASALTQPLAEETLYYVQNDGSLMPAEVKPDYAKLPMLSLSDICDEATALKIKNEDTISLSDSYSDILNMSPLVIKSENTTVSLSDTPDVITLNDTPIQPKKNLHTPPRGSGYTPGAKKKLYVEEQPLSGGSQESKLERQMILTQRALEENTYAMKRLTDALSKISFK